MKTENKILKHLLDIRGEKTIRDISKEIKSDYKITNVAIKRLEDKKIIAVKEIGHSKIVTLNNVPSKELFFAEYERQEEILKNKDILILLKTIRNNLKTKMFSLLLFGSFAKKTQNKTSDIDIALICENKEIEKDAEFIIKTLPLKIHLIFLTEDEFKKSIDTKKFNVAHEIMKNNIILYGIENYYGLIN